jgi:uncharacterized LabA/DUF88 family protein
VLAETFLRKGDVLADIFYFTALAVWDDEKVARHNTYIKAQELFGVKLVYGQFRKVKKQCRICNQKYSTFEEKETDVNIAIKLYEMARTNTYDTAIIVSGDSDLVPVVQAIKNTFPNKKIGVLIPPGGKANFLKKSAHFYHKIELKYLSASLLPDTLTLADGSNIDCPASWK